MLLFGIMYFQLIQMSFLIVNYYFNWLQSALFQKELKMTKFLLQRCLYKHDNVLQRHWKGWFSIIHYEKNQEFKYIMWKMVKRENA